MVSCLFHRMSDFQAYDPTRTGGKRTRQVISLSSTCVEELWVEIDRWKFKGWNREPCARINVLHEDWRRRWNLIGL